MSSNVAPAGAQPVAVRLPEIVLRNAIFPFLDGKDLALALRVNKQWNAQIASTPQLAKAVSTAKEAVYSRKNGWWLPIH